jgi:hypothetical protein
MEIEAYLYRDHWLRSYTILVARLARRRKNNQVLGALDELFGLTVFVFVELICWNKTRVGTIISSNAIANGHG